IARRPQQLLSQLKDGGRLAAIIRKPGGVSRGAIYTRSGEAFACTEKFDAATRAVLDGFKEEKTFVF
ncbi:MAG: protein-L-isoaspartate O-methyltransferase, partial [Hyphococcus sp.]